MSVSANTLLRQARRWGLRLEARGDKLAVVPARSCPPEFADLLRQHKAELLAMLDGRAADLPPDCWPWLHTARQVLHGEFDGADLSTIESLSIGLRAIHHPLCEQALAKLPDNKEKQRA